MKQRLYVNKKGFISIYGLSILLIFISFVSVLTITCYTFYKTATYDSMIDICILHYVNQAIGNEAPQHDEESTATQESALENVENTITITCDNQMVQLSKREQMYEAQYLHQQDLIFMQIQFDGEDIMDVVYNPEFTTE